MSTDLGFIDRLPPHKAGLALYHNEHRNYYQTVAEWIALDAGDYTWKDESSKQKAIETNELWLLHWYPDTPVACYSLAAPSLEELLEMAAEAAGVDHRGESGPDSESDRNCWHTLLGGPLLMKTTLDNALTRWSVVCRVWEDFAAGNSPILGAFLAGWFTRDMGLPIPDDLPAVGCDSFRKAWQECDSFLIILNRQQQ